MLTNPFDVLLGFAEGKPYAMEAPNGRNFITTQYAVLAHGKSEREFPFIACSDSSITEVFFLLNTISYGYKGGF